MKKLILFIALFLFCAGFANAAIITQSADSLNFEDSSKSMIVTVDYNCTGSRQFNVTVPVGSGFTIDFTTGACTRPNSQLTVCNFNGLQSGTYEVSNPSAASTPYYTVTTFPSFLSDYTNCEVQQNISFIKIPDQEIFHTLVEFGRGRGNYFYDTLLPGAAGSGHTGTGCNYVPNGTLFELNFLHKVLNIRQYFNNPDYIAKNATFTCSYPDRTIVREHLGTSIVRGGGTINITYFIDEIEGSWERMGFLGMDFDSNEQTVGENLTISCSGISYFLDGSGGDVTVFTSGGSSFNLEVRDPYPFGATASTTSTIGNGTQEVLITYTITNNEVYTVDDVIIEIEAPEYATFIGTRGELWGSALNTYRFERTQMAAGESETIQLFVRFDTSSAPNINSINLTQGIKAKYVTCWELNAYNPSEYVQTLTDIGSGTVNMAITSQIFDIQSRLDTILNSLAITNTTLISINSTVNDIETVTEAINQTTTETNIIVKELNNTVNAISGNVTEALNNTYLIITDTTAIKELINCDTIADTPICQDLVDMNTSATNIIDLLQEINVTLSNFTVNITVDLSEENLTVDVTPDISNITLIVNRILDNLNCTNMSLQPPESVCNKIIRIQNTTYRINESITTINDLVNYFNNTVFNGVSLTDIYNSLSNITIDTTSLLSEIQKIREFGEELIFLITDSFGLQQSARTDLANGDLNSAASKLREANNRLKEVSSRLNELQAETVDEQEDVTKAAAKEGSWLAPLFAFFVIAIIVVIYLFSKPPQKRKWR